MKIIWNYLEKQKKIVQENEKKNCSLKLIYSTTLLAW